MLDIRKFVRRSFPIDAVKVTEDNIKEVAQWCGGPIKTAMGGNGKTFIEVKVKNPINDRQKQAFVGDWILRNPNGYKVYTERAFHAAFEPERTELDGLIGPDDVAAGTHPATDEEAVAGD